MDEVTTNKASIRGGVRTNESLLPLSYGIYLAREMYYVAFVTIVSLFLLHYVQK